MPHAPDDFLHPYALGMGLLLIAFGVVGLFATWCPPRLFLARLYGARKVGGPNDRRYRTLVLCYITLGGAYLVAYAAEAGPWHSLLNLGAVVALLLANRRHRQLMARQPK